MKNPATFKENENLVFVIKDGIFSECMGQKMAEDELKKNNWAYRLEDPTGRYILIDYDKDKARPYVKALLAKVNKLREVKLLYFCLLLLVLQFLLIVTMFIVIGIRTGNILESISKIPTNNIQATNKPAADFIPKSTIENDADFYNSELKKSNPKTSTGSNHIF